MSRTKRLEESGEPILLMASARSLMPASSAIALLTTMRSASAMALVEPTMCNSKETDGMPAVLGSVRHASNVPLCGGAAGPVADAGGRFTCVVRQFMHLRADDRSMRSSRRAKDISDSTFESGKTARLFEEPAYAGLRCIPSSGANP